MIEKRLAVFVSGRGSNFKSLYEKVKSGDICLVITDNPDAGALDYANEKNIDNYVLRIDEENYTERLLSLLNKYKIDFILLAGYLKKIPEEVVSKFKWRILNIHPALLPKFGGKGMFGKNVHKAVIDAGEKETGVTIHFIDDEYDKGLIIAQETVKVLPGDTAETLSKRVLEIEHKLYPYIVELLCRDKIKIENNRVIIKE